MKIKEGFKLRTVGGVYILVAEGLEQVDFNKLISLNPTAAYLWQEVEQIDFNEKILADLLVNKYNIGISEALADATEMLNQWIETGLIEQ